jgi:hypothetical protein
MSSAPTINWRNLCVYPQGILDNIDRKTSCSAWASGSLPLWSPFFLLGHIFSAGTTCGTLRIVSDLAFFFLKHLLQEWSSGEFVQLKLCCIAELCCLETSWLDRLTAGGCGRPAESTNAQHIPASHVGCWKLFSCTILTWEFQIFLLTSLA